MARRKGKPGAVFIATDANDVGEALGALTDTLEYLDPEALASLRTTHGPVFLYMSDMEQQGREEGWYTEASRDWRAKADTLLQATVEALQKCAPKDHYFGPRPIDDEAMEWGFWPRARNPDEDEYDDVHHKGYRENPKLRRLQQGPDVYEYRGRRIVVMKRAEDKPEEAFVQILRKTTRRGYDVDVVVAEYVSSHPFPEQEAQVAIEEWYEESKAERRTRRRRAGIRTAAEIPLEEQAERERKQLSAYSRLREATLQAKAASGLAAPPSPRKVKVTAEGPVAFIGLKGGAALFRYGNVNIELRPLGGEATSEAIRVYPDMVSATVLGPDQTVIAMFATWGGERALDRAKQEAAQHAAKNPKPDAKARKGRGRGSFMRRMMNI
jgi:hypothetical protein